MFWLQSSDHFPPQFYEIFHGEEDNADCQQQFHKLLRQIDDFLQVLTLGISAVKPEDETITIARYRMLPAEHIRVLEGDARCKLSFSF